MAQSQVQQNLVPNEPQLKDLLDQYSKNINLNFACHHIGTIQSFNPVKQTATATINYQKTYFRPDATGVFQPVLVAYPILADCPVIFLGGGGFSLTFPVAEGDECLILFNDRDLDVWFQGGGANAAVATPRLHSISDGIVLAGIRSLANTIDDFNSDAVELRNEDGTTKVSFTDDLITIQQGGDVGTGNTVTLGSDQVSVQVASGITLTVTSEGKITITNGTGEFVAALVQLFTDIQNGLVTTMLGPEPLVMPTYATDLEVLESFS